MSVCSVKVLGVREYECVLCQGTRYEQIPGVGTEGVQNCGK